MESVLVADCGSTATRVCLIDLVDNQYRLVAGGETSSTVEAPWSRMYTAVREATRQIEGLTGRMLLDKEEQLIVPEREDGRGVDGFVATVSAAVPLQLAVVGLIRSLSVESLLKAADSSYVFIQNVVAIDDTAPHARRRGSMVSMLNDFLQNRPDAILIGGGVDGGAVAPVLEMAGDIAAVLSALGNGGRVHVVFAGNRDTRSQIAQVLGECSDLHVVDNVRPTLETEDLRAAEEEIDRLYREYKMARAPGFGELRAWASAPVLPTAEGFGLVLRYLARHYQLDVLGVDVGGASTNIAGVIGGRYGSTVGSGLGVSYGMSSMLEQGALEGVLRWLPFEMEAEEAENIILNKALRPMTVPQTTEELLLEQAVAREAISLTLKQAGRRWLNTGSSLHSGLLPPVDLIVGRGGVLSQAPEYRQATLILLDALQPTGVCTLALDKASLLPQLGVLALVHPLAAAEVVTQDGSLNLGTVISLVGTAREGALALRVKMEYDDGQTIEVEVAYGVLEVIPLPLGKRAVVELRPSSRFDVGLGKKGKAARTEVEGGAVGVIVDARGRPLFLPEDEEKRRVKIQGWMSEVGL
jgi:uncharacterized protein (TIGR01319 family)